MARNMRLRVVIEWDDGTPVKYQDGKPLAYTEQELVDQLIEQIDAPKIPWYKFTTKATLLPLVEEVAATGLKDAIRALKLQTSKIVG